MTSISQPALPPQQSSNPSQSVPHAQPSPASYNGRTPPQAAGTAPTSARSYASATKKQSSPTSATYTSNPVSAAGVAGPTQHGKSSSISPVNGKTPITPAVPAMGAPTLPNGYTTSSSTSGPVDHGRKASITITQAGTSGYLPNGGPAGGKPAGGNNIQFGNFNPDGSPAMAKAIPQPSQAMNSLAVIPPQDPRIISPVPSPSPIPQPAASGGRPPSSLQGQTNGMSFGSLPIGEDPLVSRSDCNTILIPNFGSSIKRDQMCLRLHWALDRNLATFVGNLLNLPTATMEILGWALLLTEVGIHRKVAAEEGATTANMLNNSNK